MKLNDIISKSVPAFVLTLENVKNIEKTFAYLELNKLWLEKFDNVIFSLNGKQTICDSFINKVNDRHNYNAIKLFSETNLGHTFGTLDNDRKIFEYGQQNSQIEYIWKFSMDIVADPSIFDIEIDESCGFFYLNNIGYAASDKYSKEELLSAILDQTYFYPQTNYYIYKNNLDKWLPEHSDILAMKEKYENIKQDHPTYHPWDAIQGEDAGLPDGEGCACEAYLAQTILSQDIKKQQLMSKEDLAKLIDLIYDHKVYDGSHKNFLFTNVGGICHYHVMNGMAVRV